MASKTQQENGLVKMTNKQWDTMVNIVMSMGKNKEQAIAHIVSQGYEQPCKSTGGISLTVKAVYGKDSSLVSDTCDKYAVRAAQESRNWISDSTVQIVTAQKIPVSKSLLSVISKHSKVDNLASCVIILAGSTQKQKGIACYIGSELYIYLTGETVKADK